MIENGMQPECKGNRRPRGLRWAQVIVATVFLLLVQVLWATWQKDVLATTLPLSIVKKERDVLPHLGGEEANLPRLAQFPLRVMHAFMVRRASQLPVVRSVRRQQNRVVTVYTEKKRCVAGVCITMRSASGPHAGVRRPTPALQGGKKTSATTRVTVRRVPRSTGPDHPYSTMPIHVPVAGRLTTESLQRLQHSLPTLFAKPAFVSREAWGAKTPPASSRHVSDCFVKYVVLHHTASTPNRTQTIGAFLNGIEKYHIGRNFPGLAYRALVGLDGQLYEGFRRQGHGSATALDGGAASTHARNFNCGSFGISLIGDYENKHTFNPDNAVGRKLINTIVYAATRSGRSKLSYNSHGQLELQTVKLIGHKHTGHSNTNCPGKTVNLPQLTSRVHQHIRYVLEEHIRSLLPQSNQSPA